MPSPHGPGYSGLCPGRADGLSLFPFDHHEGKADEGDKEREDDPHDDPGDNAAAHASGTQSQTRRGEGHAEGKKPRHCLFESQGKYDRSLTRHDEDGGEVFQNACGLEGIMICHGYTRVSLKTLSRDGWCSTRPSDPLLPADGDVKRHPQSI